MSRFLMMFERCMFHCVFTERNLVGFYIEIVSRKNWRYFSLTMWHVCVGKVLLIARRRIPLYIKRIKYAKQNEKRTAKTRYEYMHTDASLIPCAVGLSVKCVPLRLSVRDTSRSSRSSYVTGNGGEFSSSVHDCVRSLAIVARWLYGSACSEANFKADERG